MFDELAGVDGLGALRARSADEGCEESAEGGALAAAFSEGERRVKSTSRKKPVASESDLMRTAVVAPVNVESRTVIWEEG